VYSCPGNRFTKNLMIYKIVISLSQLKTV